MTENTEIGNGCDPLQEAKKSPVGSYSAAYRLAMEQRAFEITQLTNRNNFFMVFQGVLLGGMLQSQGTAPVWMNFLVCLAGMVISLFQAGMASGAKYWQIRWEAAVKEMELLLLESLKDEKRVMQLFTSDALHLTSKDRKRITVINQSDARKNDALNEEEGYIDKLIEADLDRTRGLSIAKFAIKRRYSVSQIPIWVGLTLFLLWFGLWSNTFTVCEKHLFTWLSHLLSNLVTFDWFRLVAETKSV
jgi:hypothetical protein